MPRIRLLAQTLRSQWPGVPEPHIPFHRRVVQLQSCLRGMGVDGVDETGTGISFLGALRIYSLWAGIPPQEISAIMLQLYLGGEYLDIDLT